MLAYNDGNIVAKIKESILSHDGMRDRFSSLAGSDNDVDNQLILLLYRTSLREDLGKEDSTSSDRRAYMRSIRYNQKTTRASNGGKN